MKYYLESKRVKKSVFSRYRRFQHVCFRKNNWIIMMFVMSLSFNCMAEPFKTPLEQLLYPSQVISKPSAIVNPEPIRQPLQPSPFRFSFPEVYPNRLIIQDSKSVPLFGINPPGATTIIIDDNRYNSKGFLNN